MPDRIRQLQRDRAVARELLKIYDKEYVREVILKRANEILPVAVKEYEEAMADLRGYKLEGKNIFRYMGGKFIRFFNMVEKLDTLTKIRKMIRKWDGKKWWERLGDQ